jgi:hypothetical protein
MVAAMLIPAGAAAADAPDADPNAGVVENPTTTVPVTSETADPPAGDPGASSADQQPVEQQSPASDDTNDSPSTPAVADEGDTSTPPSSGGGEVTSPNPPSQGTEDTGDAQDPTPVQPSHSFEDYSVSGLVAESGVHVAVVGRALTVQRIAPPLEDAEYAYAWYVGGGWRSAETTFIPEERDLGKEVRLDISVRVGETYGNGIQEVVASDTVLDAGTANPNDPGSSDPTGPGEFVPAPDQWTHYVFSGLSANEWDEPVAVVGKPITAHPTTLWPAGTTFQYEWHIGDWDGPVRGTEKTYLPDAADLGHEIYAVITPSPEDGSTWGGGELVAFDTVTDPDAPGEGSGEVQPMPQGQFQLQGANNYTVGYGTTISATPVGWPADAEYVLRWTVDGVQVGQGPTFTPAAGHIGQFVNLSYEVRAPGYKEFVSAVSVGLVQAEPTVTVSAPSITVGSTATVKVKVAGPEKAPVPSGAVELLLLHNGLVVDQLQGQLENGVATYTIPHLAVGTYGLTASYTGNQIWSRMASILDFPLGSYTFAQGEGTLQVVAGATTVSAPATVTVPVATRGSFTATVSAPGSHLPATWSLTEGGAVLSDGLVHEGGSFTVPVPVLSVGTHTLVLSVPATKWAAAGSTTVTVVVVGEPVRTGTQPTAQLESPKAATAPGQQMELVAEGFEPGETVAFYLHSDPVFLGTAVADANGIARLMATVPADVPSGSHTVYATGGTTGRWAVLPVELAVAAPAVSAPVVTPVQAAAPAATRAGELAVTGSSAGVLGLAAAFLVAVGGGLLVVTRRVRATR